MARKLKSPTSANSIKDKFLNALTAPRLAVIMQFVTAVILAISAAAAYSTWQSEIGKRQTDSTLKYFDQLMARDYISYLWEIHEFTICFEKASGRHISYRRFQEVRLDPEDKKLAAEWWGLVENHLKRSSSCGKPESLEEKLMVVFGRLEALASCSRQKLCSYKRTVDMLEAFDYVTVLTISNYLLFTHLENISREWTTFGAFPDLIALIERYVFDGRAAAQALANDLDKEKTEVPSRSILSPAQIKEIWNKSTPCDLRKEDNAWFLCKWPE